MSEHPEDRLRPQRSPAWERASQFDFGGPELRQVAACEHSPRGVSILTLIGAQEVSSPFRGGRQISVVLRPASRPGALDRLPAPRDGARHGRSGIDAADRLLRSFSVVLAAGMKRERVLTVDVALDYELIEGRIERPSKIS